MKQLVTIFILSITFLFLRSQETYEENIYFIHDPNIDQFILSATNQNEIFSSDFDLINANEKLDTQLLAGANDVGIDFLESTVSLRHDFNSKEHSASAALPLLPDAPPVIAGTGDQLYCPGGSMPVAQTITISDPDDTSTTAVYIQISGGYVNGEDLLTLTGSHPSITSSWDAVQGELTLQGPATYTEFETAVLATQYSSSSASPSGTKQFSITVGEPNYLPTTGHYYEFVSAPGITWTDAQTAASNRTYFGLQGYLATLTSQVEADFSGEQANGFGWIGANDVAVEGEWRWVTGPEAGTLFWNGSVGGTEITFANWNGGEPNNCCGGEDYAHIAAAAVIRGGAPIGAWNDLRNTGGGGNYASQGYVVEYGGMPGDPTLYITLTTSLDVSLCHMPTNRRITYRVNKN